MPGLVPLLSGSDGLDPVQDVGTGGFPAHRSGRGSDRGTLAPPDCRPVPGAAVDLQHCDERGRYDNDGFRYRGHRFTDAAGAYRFETIRPGLYPGRAPHFHVKVKGEATRLLTTQLYFPDRPHDNIGDPIYREGLLLRLDRADDTWLARFDFVLAPA